MPACWPCDLAPKTLQLYEELARLWINADHQLPAPAARGGAGRSATVNSGEMELGALTVAVIREWFAAAVHTTDTRAARRAGDKSARADRQVCEQLHAARAWAPDNGLRVGATGRLSAVVLRAWEDA